MTSVKRDFKIKIGSIICIFIVILTLAFGNELKNGVKYGIGISYSIIIPTLFPFFILSDLWSKCLSFSSGSLLGRIFKRVFGINEAGASAFICGMFCGFPIGVKATVDYYQQGRINRDEAQLLCALSSNPSCAFVISGIGLGIYRDVKIGILLYFCVIISALIVGRLLRIKHSKTQFTHDNSGQSFNLVDSIKNAGLSSIAVSSYIIFFSALTALFRSICKNKALNILFVCFAEISSASLFMKDIYPFPTPISLALTAFALGFSGFSVHLQAFSFMPREISKFRFLLAKLLVGFFSFIITAIIFYILKV